MKRSTTRRKTAPTTGVTAVVAGWFRAYPDASACFLLILLAGLICLPALIHALPNGDDLAQHYWWATEFKKELQDGVLYPRWLSGAYAGRGSPVMLYYPPLPFYFTAPIQSIVGDTLTAIGLGCWLALALSGISMYALSRAVLPRSSSLIAAAFYVVVHYHLFDFYQRAALNEFWAMAWIPLVFHAGYLVASGRGLIAAAYLAAGYGLLALTHLPSMLVVSIVLPLAFLIQTRRIERLLLAGLSGVLGLGVAAIYLSSVFFETYPLQSMRGVSRPRFREGFLLEHLGSAFANVPLPSNGNFSLFVRFGDWLALGFLVLIVAVTPVAWLNWRDKTSKLGNNGLLAAAWVVTVTSFLMTTRITEPLWLIIPRLRLIQFPIRWFVLASMGASLLVAVSFAGVTKLKRTIPMIATLAVALTLNLALSALVIVRAPFEPEALRRRLVNYTDVMEYHPRWWDKQRHVELDKAPAFAESGEADIDPVDETGTSQSYRVNARTETTLKFRTIYFPGWIARVNGQPVEIGPNSEGHVELKLAPGIHHLTLDFEDTKPRRLGKVASGGSVLLLIAIVVAARLRRARGPQAGPEGEPQAKAIQSGKPRPKRTVEAAGRRR